MARAAPGNSRSRTPSTCLEDGDDAFKAHAVSTFFCAKGSKAPAADLLYSMKTLFHISMKTSAVAVGMTFRPKRRRAQAGVPEDLGSGRRTGHAGGSHQFLDLGYAKMRR